MFNVKWGIIGPGGISSTFVDDLLLPSHQTHSGRDQTIKHSIVAVGSRDVLRARKFVRDHVGTEGGCKSYAGYEGVFADENVDVVYIGTTHTHHYAATKAALLAGKHVLAEKPFTTTAREARALINLAREKSLFLMEAVWTRFQPMVIEIEELVRGGKIGDVRRIFADLGWDAQIDGLSSTSRVISPELAGGALLDLGPYPLLWPLLLIPEASTSLPSSISASIQKTQLDSIASQVDAQTSFVLNYDQSKAQAILSCSITSETFGDSAVVIHGSKGTISIQHPCFRPESYTVKLFAETEAESTKEEETVVTKIAGRGMYWMGDEVGRCLRDGKLESERMGLEVTLLQMEIFDEVRRQGGYELPEIEL
ncbi:hypothetical protein BDY24DRAFT_399464 [Mrakia frigida]|uniref:Gfo/Idh/MocA family protein n=1 Tax=Mrakia frigida TaxID=29902 RepID=UPI003FCC0A84